MKEIIHYLAVKYYFIKTQQNIFLNEFSKELSPVLSGKSWTIYSEND